MTSRLSQSIVDFIAELAPLYRCQYADGQQCALSLFDGSLILPLDEGENQPEEGWVEIYWQGDVQRRSEVPGAELAGVAVWRHLELRGVGRSPAETTTRRQQLAEHFRRCTGLSLPFEATVPPLMTLVS